MPVREHSDGPSGRYRDVLLDRNGRVMRDRGWRPNAIVGGCHRLLATLLRGVPSASGILGLQIGAGSPDWDRTGPPPATAAQTELVDRHPFTLTSTDGLRMDFLDGAGISDRPTNRLQIQATLGPNLPNWPDPHHDLANLREFGLVARLGNDAALINYVTHLVIAKDPASTLQRTIWLTF